MQAPVGKLSDKALVTAIQRSCLEARQALAKLLVLLIEVEERNLHLKEAFPSMFAFCRDGLRMSDGEAFRRTTAAKLIKRFPKLLRRIEQGDIHLSALVQLRHCFHDANVEHLVDAVKGKNKFEIAELVARLAPRPGGKSTLRKLPHHTKQPNVSTERRPHLEPMAEALYRLQVFGDRAFRDKLFRARDLLMHTNPTGDLSVVVGRAIDALLKALEKRYGRITVDAHESSIEPSAVHASGVHHRAVKINARDSSTAASDSESAEDVFEKTKLSAATMPHQGKKKVRSQQAPGIVRAGSHLPDGEARPARFSKSVAASIHLRQRMSPRSEVSAQQISELL